MKTILLSCIESQHPAYPINIVLPNSQISTPLRFFSNVYVPPASVNKNEWISLVHENLCLAFDMGNRARFIIQNEYDSLASTSQNSLTDVLSQIHKKHDLLSQHKDLSNCINQLYRPLENELDPDSNLSNLISFKERSIFQDLNNSNESIVIQATTAKPAIFVLSLLILGLIYSNPSESCSCKDSQSFIPKTLLVIEGFDNIFPPTSEDVLLHAKEDIHQIIKGKYHSPNLKIII